MFRDEKFVFKWGTIPIAVLQQSQYAKKEKNREIFWTTRDQNLLSVVRTCF